jgi:putative ABC transport system permease protein
MKALSALWFSLRALVRRRRADAEMDEELAYHLEREASLHEARGLSVASARREAMVRFGGIQRYREECRDVRRMRWLDDARADIRFALRLVRLHPGFSGNVILISALGIAACVTTFSIVSGILLSPLPFSASERIASIQLRSAEGSATSAIPVASYLRLDAGAPLVDAVATASPGGAAVDWNGEPERLKTYLVTPSFFRVFGVAPAIGRAFTTADADERAPVVLLGHEAWRTRFDADTKVVGRLIRLDGVAYTVLGVMPPRFRAHFNTEPDLWLPLKVTAAGVNGRPTANAIVRLAEGVTHESAETWLATVIRAKMPSNTHADSVAASPALVPIRELIYGDVQRPLFVLLGAVLLVLALVAANVATMFLARSAARERELGLRRALGASRGRQLRQLVTEAATLTAIGGVVGFAASWWAVTALRGLGWRVLPRMDAVSVDWRVTLFAIGGTIVMGILGGLAPTLAARREDRMAMRDGHGLRVTSQGTSSTLVIAQIALSVVLLVGAGLLVKSFARVAPRDPGFALENRAMIGVTLRGRAEYPDSDRLARRRFIHEVSERMRRVPGVRDATAMSFAPFSGSASTADIRLPGRPVPAKPFSAFQNFVTPNYFDVMEIALKRGRTFGPRDDEGAERVAIVNETAAARWWPGEDPIGQQLMGESRESFTARVVGVARDGRLFGSDTKSRLEIYLPVAQANPGYVAFIVHTAADPRSVARDLRRAVWSVVPDLPIGTSSDLATIAAESVSQTRFFSWAMGAFASVGVVLTGLAVYGLLAFAVTERRREIGIRMALGASPKRVGAVIVRRALVLGGIGIVLGTVLARMLSRYMSSLLLEVAATDGAVFVAAAGGVLVIAVIAACAPAYRAIRVDPVQSLRT